MKKVILALLLIILAVALISCGGSANTNTETETDTDSQTDIVKPAETDSNTATQTESSDTQTQETETETETDTDTAEESDTDTSTEVDIPKDFDYKAPTVEGELKNELVVFDKDDYGNEGNVLSYKTSTNVDLSIQALNKPYKIDKGGEYKISGKTTTGRIEIKAKDQDVIIVLDGVEIVSQLDNPAIYAEDCKSLTIILKDGTTNILSDTANNTGEKAVLRVRSCNLTISGKGNLEINANSKYGIANTKELTIDSGNIKITSPNHAIYGKLGVNINGGKITLDAGKSGIKSGDEEDQNGPVQGYVNFNASSTSIKCGTNGISSFGSVVINDGKIVVDAKEGNGIDASEDVEINGGTLVFNTYKSAITSDKKVTLGGKSNAKLITKGNGVSATDVTISTSGVIYIKTTAVYFEATVDTPAEDTRYCLIDDEYVKYDPLVHGINKKLYVRKDCRGVEADGILTITSGTIGIDSYEDAFNAKQFAATGGEFVLKTRGDAIDASNSIEFSQGAVFTVLNSEKGLNADTILISGGTFSVTAEKDSINAKSTVINGGTLYLFEKIDLGESGTVSVNGGTILMVCTNKTPQATGGSAKYISGIINRKDVAKIGAWVRVKSGDDEVIVQLTKAFTDKMVVYYSSNTMGDSISIELGKMSSNEEFVPLVKAEELQ